ncbi:probable methyltransferase-like protein 24 [Ylistrum balloti]|uniref:probable methyltransferase-like protein 24 n=1 Tax=Ylistrum balloti TaxID=509963 RepID=UPI0029058A13|nr:probable methyltransferase-like protein 24 [Ylistrum balloti]
MSYRMRFSILVMFTTALVSTVVFTSSSIQKTFSGVKTFKDMRISDEIMKCVLKSISNPYIYDYTTDFYLLPPVSDLCRMTLPDLELLYQRYLSTIQTVCKTPRRFGKITDGGWDICVEPKYLPRNKCLVYSFGIANDFSFDDDIARFYNCEVHSFDPSMRKKGYVRIKDQSYFHDTGLSHITRSNPEGNMWRMQTFLDIRTELNHLKRMPNVVKMDIEAWEWNVLPEMFAAGQFPKQLIIEFHLWSQKYTTQRDMWIHRLSVLRNVYDAGYRIFWMNRNLICRYKSLYTKQPTLACHEISLIRNGPNITMSSSD